MNLNESIVEDAALECFGEQTRYARALTPALSHGEREEDGEVVLVGRLREAIRRLNPALSVAGAEEVVHQPERQTV